MQIVNNCILEFEYVKEGWIYRFDFRMQSEKLLYIKKVEKPTLLEEMYNIYWFLDTNQTKIQTFKSLDITLHSSDVEVIDTLIDGLVCPFNISPERIKKLLIFS